MKDFFILSPYAVSSVLMAFAEKLGIHQDFARACTNAYLEDLPNAHAWANFTADNCCECAKDPGSCDFLHPRQHPPGVDSRTVEGAIALQVMSGRVVTCPAIVPLLRG